MQLSAEQLSDGERSQLLLAATLARRLFLLDPKASNPLDTQAIVLIDEIELHLHPAWQREILATLLRTFPKVQFVVSTHSAPVLSTVKSGNVRVLQNFHAYAVNDPVEGRDANSLLEDVLGVPARPKDFVEKFREITALIDQSDKDESKLDEAALKLSMLEAIVGSSDSEIVRLRAMLEFLTRDSDEDHAAEDD